MPVKSKALLKARKAQPITKLSGQLAIPPRSAPTIAAIHGALEAVIPIRPTKDVGMNSQKNHAPAATNASAGSGAALPFSRDRNKRAVSAGLSVSELNVEINIDTAIVSAN